jgi:xanthine dehydrogenase YagR molybdenum-binding subunit
MTTYIGTATSRVDGRAKVTGMAQYAAEFQAPDLAYGAIVTSTITKGTVRSIDASRALAVPGVLDVLTHQNRPPLAGSDDAYKDDVAPDGSPYRPLYDNKIMFNGQPVALVVAETSEVAVFAASLVQIEYDRQPRETDIFSQLGAAVPIKKPSSTMETMFAPPKMRGKPDDALAAAAVRHEAEYFVPIEHHNPMELYAATAVYDIGGKLRVYDKTQGVQNVHKYLCNVFGVKPEDVRVMSPYMGGGFGSGLRPQFEAVLAVLAAVALKRSVRVVLTRAQMYVLGYRPAMVQRIAMGANADGTLDVITHDAVTVTSKYEDFHRQETGWSGVLYKSPNAKYAHRLAKLDLATSCDMRAPSATTAMFALESAMDELALAVKLDPLELRLRC